MQALVQNAPMIIGTIVVAMIIFSNIRVVQQQRVFIINRLGKFQAKWDPGLHFKIPFLDTVYKVVDLKEQTIDIPSAMIQTKDKMSLEINGFMFLQVTDPQLFAFANENPVHALRTKVAASLRSIVGKKTLEEVMGGLDTINAEMTSYIDSYAAGLGCKVASVSIKNLKLDPEIQAALDQKVKAEAHKTAGLLASQETAERKIIEAEALILEAKSKAEAQVTLAKAEADAHLLRQQAQADGIEALNRVKPSPEALQLAGYKALETMANGQSNTIIVPSELQSVATLATTFSQVGKK